MMARHYIQDHGKERPNGLKPSYRLFKICLKNLKAYFEEPVTWF